MSFYSVEIKISKSDQVISLFLFMTCFVLSLHCTSQTLYDLTNHEINRSHPNNVNVNHAHGRSVQDSKRSAGLLAYSYYNEKEDKNKVTTCSCNLVNNTKQKKTPYVTTAAHCLEESYFQVNNVTENIYMTFNYEMPHATIRSDPNWNISITKIEKVNIKILVYDTLSDIALFQITGKNTEGEHVDEIGKNIDKLLENAYAAGWDNSALKLAENVVNISHPKSDHKKIFMKPSNIVPDYGTVGLTLNSEYSDRITAFLYKYYAPWNYDDDLRYTNLESGSSGSGVFYTKTMKIMTILSTNIEPYKTNDYSENKVYAITNLLHNSWYGKPNVAPPILGLGHFLAPDDASYINSIPGAYYNDRIETSGEIETLNIPPGESVTKQQNLISNWIIPKISFDQGLYNQDRRSIMRYWENISGIKLVNPNDSKVFLLVHYLDKNPTTKKTTKRLIYGSYADANVAEGEGGFREMGWDCDNPPPNFPKCNRFLERRQGQSTDVRRSFYTSAIDLHKKQGKDKLTAAIRSIKKQTILPIKVTLHNSGSDPVSVAAFSYPGQVILNANQFSKPWKSATDILFLSRNYKTSRGNNSEQLYIESIKLQHRPASSTEVVKNITIPTGNNGGYVNLVNPNFKIFQEGGVELSYTDENGERKINKLRFDITLRNPENQPFSYAIYLDYFNSEELDGVDPDHYYNFVNDPVSHTIEIVHIENDQTQNILYSYPLPHHSEVNMLPGDTRKTRLRIAVKRGSVSPNPAGIFDSGEVEDYLIELYVPDCAKITPEAYAIYAGNMLAYCGEDSYQEDKKEKGDGGWQVPSFGGVVSGGTDKTGNVPYASAKAVASWYQNVNALSSGTPLVPSPVPAIAGFDPKVLNVPTTLEETDPAQLIDQTLAMDIYYPLVQDGKTLDDLIALPLIIYLPDGAFAWNRRQTDLTVKTCQWLAAKGNVVAAIDYRTGIYGDEQISKRAVIRAWQDSRAAVKWWSMPQNETRTDAGGDLLWKIDQSKIYILGHGAGGITALHNLYLSEGMLNGEVADKADGSSGLLAAIGAGYDLNGQNTYDLRDYEPIPCLDVNGINTCDAGIISRATNGTYGQYTGSDTNISNLLTTYNSTGGQAKKAVAMGGGMLNDEWALGDGLNTPGPAAVIHHVDDAVVAYDEDHLIVRSFGQSVNATLDNYTVAEIDGSGEIREAWENEGDDGGAGGGGKGVLKWIELNNDTETTGGGGGNYLPHHVPQFAFADEYDTYAGSGDADELKLSKEVLYFADALFVKDWSGGIASRVATQQATVPAVAQQASKKDEELFTIFPNPAEDEVSMILTVKESGLLDITFTDLQGKQVYRHYTDYITAGVQWVRISDLNLPNGTYIVNVKAAEIMKQEKLIINRK